MAEYFLLMSVVDTIPLKWKTILKQQLQTAHADTHDSKDVVFPTSSRVLYWDLVKKIEAIPTSKCKYEELFPTTDLPKPGNSSISYYTELFSLIKPFTKWV